jgi:hypothetical protein
MPYALAVAQPLIRYRRARDLPQLQHHPVPRPGDFVVFAVSPDPAANTTNDISPDLIPIARAIAAEKPDLTLYLGDLVNGWELTNASPMENNFTGQLGNRMADVAPIHNYTAGTGIPIYSPG